MQSTDPAGKDVRDTIDREAGLVEGAVRLVASGATARTIVAGLSLGSAALTLVQPLADSFGVVLEPLWRSDEDGIDVIVRRGDRPGGGR